MPPQADTTPRFDALRVEGQQRPVGIDIAHPSFTWQLREGGMQYPPTLVELIAVPADGAQRSVWWRDLPAGHDPQVRHDGSPLDALTRYRWQLSARVAGNDITAAAEFSTGMLAGADWAGARWLGAPHTEPTHPRGATPVPAIFRDVSVDDEPVFALLFVAAGGYAQPWIDGRAVGDELLSPAFSDYDKRLHYAVYDVTSLVPAGSHRLEFRLGRGFYGMTNPSPPPAWGWESAPWHGEPAVRGVLHLMYADGARRAVATGSGWLAQRTPTLYDDLYGGETWDERAIASVTTAVVVDGPLGAVQRERIEPIRVTRRLQPAAITARAAGDYVVDFGQVIAGRVRIRVDSTGQHGITLAHGEKLTSEGLPNVADGEHYFSDGFQTDRCHLTGPGEWAPSFTYHGFRYVHVTGWPADEVLTVDAIAAEVMHTDVETIGDFRCSIPLLNALHEAAIETVRINLHGLPTDTPTYEKNGWTGDGMLAAELMLVNLDSEVLLEKWLDDIADSRDDDGRPQVIAPSPGWGDRFKPSPTWHSDYVLLPWWLYWYRGNVDVLARHYEGAKRYALHEYAMSTDGLSESVLNDWCSPETGAWGGDAPDDHRVSGTAYLYLMLVTMSHAADVLGHTTDHVRFDQAAAHVRAAFVAEFFDAEHGIFRGQSDLGYRQTHNILALAFGLVPDGESARVVRCLVADIRDRDDHLNTGVLGSKYVLPVLTRHGHEALALRVATQTTFPSWGMWIVQGSTTLWEHWKEESRSRAHYMFGTYDDWFFQDVLGVQALEPGYRRIRIAPADLGDMTSAEGTVPTPFGPIEVSWVREDGCRRLRARIPTGCVADVILRNGSRTVDITVGGGEHEWEVPS